MKFPGARRLLYPPALLALVASGIAIGIFGFFMVPHAHQLGFDDGYEIAAAERLIDGRWLPYVDSMAHRGPFLYWFLAIAQVLTGRFEWTGGRALTLVSCLVTVWGTFAFGWAARFPVAGAIGAAAYVYAVAVGYDLGAGLAVAGEPVGIAVLMLAFSAAAYAGFREEIIRRRYAWLAGAGALLGIATFTKQTLAFAVVPMGLMVGLCELHRAGEKKLMRALRHALLPFIAGGLGLVALLALRYALAGELGSVLYWAFGYNARVYLEPYQGRVVSTMLDWFYGQPYAAVPLGMAVAVGVGRRLSRPPAIFETTVALAAVTQLVASAYGLRGWPHYFIPIWPWIGLLFGVCLELVLRRDDETTPLRSQIAVAAVVGGMLVFTGGGRLVSLFEQRAQGWHRNPRPEPLCAEIDRIAGPGRTPVFMWGSLGDLYITCQRPSASFFTYTFAVAGVMPPFWGESTLARTAPGSREKVIAELTANPPPVILDAPLYAPVSPFTMMSFPIFATFVNERYCRASVTRDSLKGREITIYARKDLPACATAQP